VLCAASKLLNDDAFQSAEGADEAGARLLVVEAQATARTVPHRVDLPRGVWVSRGLWGVNGPGGWLVELLEDWGSGALRMEGQGWRYCRSQAGQGSKGLGLNLSRLGCEAQVRALRAVGS
jgi:hypothetical protein